ncbi:unnamed protein product [Clonostachys rhizophaga]|uniref:Cytochrome P450 n=1 Tax=Clonostachys rhizophaga TaxID=160324 RepID=A0A9N9VYJ6_9HYPO|nr:unnamed protein product [Clonostachys rhizophaga]
MGWLLATILSLLFFVLFLFPVTAKDTVRGKIDRARRIADLSSRNLVDRLRARAGPNTRLVQAFGVNNSFTTVDESIHRQFLRRALEIIKSANAKRWVEAQHLASETAAALCCADGNVGGLNIEHICRVMCFVTALGLIFPTTRQTTFDYERLNWITQTINDLWVQSKSKGPQNDRLLSKLRDELQSLLPEERDDPLALILPAYETLWRVVLLTYVHVAFRHIDGDTKVMLQEILKRFHDPEQVEFDSRMVRFSQEALRLYPPTKRIYRASWFGAVAADVESLHHGENIWGPDALEFRPSRFEALTRNQKDAFMPFGIGRHACPASNSFAGKLIGILVVTLIKQLGTAESGTKIKFDDEELDDECHVMAPLPTGRSVTKNWVVYPNPES